MDNIKLLSKTVAASNKWTTVVKEEFSFGQDHKGEYLIVERLPAIMILPLIRDNGQFYTYMVKQYRYPIARDVWQFPMGTLENDKNPQQHASDELKEETGIIAGKMTFFKEYYIDPGLSRQRCLVYIAEDIIEGGKQELEATEMGMERRKISIEELELMLTNGDISDLWGYSGIHLLLEFIKSIQ